MDNGISAVTEDRVLAEFYVEMMMMMMQMIVNDVSTVLLVLIVGFY